MNAIEFSVNGKVLGTATLKDGDFSAKLIVKNHIDPAWLSVSGRDHEKGSSVEWCHTQVKIGDEVSLRLVELPEA